MTAKGWRSIGCKASVMRVEFTSLWCVREERRRLAKQRDHKMIEQLTQEIYKLQQQLHWWQEWYYYYSGDGVEVPRNLEADGAGTCQCTAADVQQPQAAAKAD